jgi:hypothetical protein
MLGPVGRQTKDTTLQLLLSFSIQNAIGDGFILKVPDALQNIRNIMEMHAMLDIITSKKRCLKCFPVNIIVSLVAPCMFILTMMKARHGFILIQDTMR